MRVLEPAGRARGEAAARTSRWVVRMRFPSRAMRWISAPRVRRACRGKPSDASGVLRAGVLVRDPDGQLLPPLLPAPGQCGAAPLRFHSRTESMRLEPARIARAVGRLPHGYSKNGLDGTLVQTGKVSRHREIGQGKQVAPRFGRSRVRSVPDRAAGERLLFPQGPDSFASPASQVIHILS